MQGHGITNVAIAGKDTTIQDQYTMPYGKSISIGFSTIAYNNHKIPVYYYKLDELDADWNATTSEKIQYEHLQPGTYTFNVYAAGWPAHGVKMSIIVTPPFWSTWWFILLEVLVALLLVVLAVYIILNIKHRKSELKRKMIENDLKSLRAQINPHFIFNALNSIQEFILNHQPRPANYYLTQFAKLIRMIVENSRKEYISLADEIDFLQLYLELEKLRLGDSFSFNISYDKELDADIVAMPPMILQPIVENCITHGLPGRKGEKTLLLSFEKQGAYICCIITDNGIGRKQARKNHDARQNISMGIDNITERMQLLYAKENIKWKPLEIVDMSNEADEATGTKVILFIPLLFLT